ncbi:uncharacterized protein LOC109703524 [Ananas comosus]|uniref:Uncharacterized protein LOC109703524 n=1 Tax=Ananas comosus TaxID=4615 RepID=A0A6P5E9C9_ANACO|nr:uncharacterized protein LOC109703524 [Ananas comosus]
MTTTDDKSSFDEPLVTSGPLLLNPSYARSKSTVHDELRSFRICLKWWALDHSSPASITLSVATFLLLALIIPTATSLFLRPASSLSSASCSSSVSFNRLAQVSESGLAAISFLTLAVFFRRYGLRQLLFLDSTLQDDSAFVRRAYARELHRAFKLLIFILLPSFSVEFAHKILFFSSSSFAFSMTFPVFLRYMPWNSIFFLASLISWVYRTGVFLLVCVLFCLTCELQILRFESFFKIFEETSGDNQTCSSAGAIFQEHLRIKTQVFKTSHRYRIFIVACLVTITISQLGALMLVLLSKSNKNFCNSGDLVVCSVVQLSGFLMCLVGAARITHRAQRVVSIASRWHMALTSILSSTPDEQGFESRQALVTYLQHNGGGITLFGFALDRGLLHTIFAFEMTLVLWILSKVVVLA